MRILYIICFFSLIVSCHPSQTISVHTASEYVGLNEKYNSKEIKDFVGVDPRYTEWCAAFVNAVLEEDGIPNLFTLNYDAPLLARSFLTWGEKVNPEDIQKGDLVIFPRGDSDWKGHVGFYIETVDGRWLILGGNQNNEVAYDYYKPRDAIGIRRNKYIY